MMTRAVQFITIFIAMISMGATGFFTYETYRDINSLPSLRKKTHASAEHNTDANGKASRAETGELHLTAAAEAYITSSASAPKNSSAILSMKEAIIHVSDTKNKLHIVAIQVNLELFDPAQRGEMEKIQSMLRDQILDTITDQNFERLKTASGKLYLRELMVSRLNGFLQAAMIRDCHLGSFYLQ